MGNLAFQEWLLILTSIVVPILLIVLLVRAFRKKSSSDSHISKTFVADEIEKLFSLKERGIITQEEFEKKKSKLI